MAIHIPRPRDEYLDFHPHPLRLATSGFPECGACHAPENRTRLTPIAQTDTLRSLKSPLPASNPE
jgi:hypothetical protein